MQDSRSISTNMLDPKKVESEIQNLMSVEKEAVKFIVHDPMINDGEKKGVFQDGDEMKIDYDLQMNIYLKEFGASNNSDCPTDKNSLQSNEIIHFRVLVLGDDYCPQKIKIELSSEDDIFFHYVCLLDENEFFKIKEDQSILIEFQDIMKMLSKLVLNVKNKICKINLIFDNNSETADLEFIQESEFRIDKLLSLKFQESKPEIIKQVISYRINKTKELNELIKERVKDISRVIEQNNPALMSEIRKGGNLKQSSDAQNFLKFIS